MASLLNILKNVLNLNHNPMHVISCKLTTTEVPRFGETFDQTRLYVHARTYKRVQKLCPVCMKKCPGYDTKCSIESSWRAPNLNGVPIYICYRPQRIEYPEHGVRMEGTFPEQMEGAVPLRTSVMKLPGCSAGCPKQLLLCSKIFTGERLETVLKQPMTV